MIAREGGTWAQRGFIAGAVACADGLGGLRKGRFGEAGWGKFGRFWRTWKGFVKLRVVEGQCCWLWELGLRLESIMAQQSVRLLIKCSIGTDNMHME